MLLDPDRYKMYREASKKFVSISFTWQELAVIDKALTEKWVNTGSLIAHFLPVAPLSVCEQKDEIQMFLDAEYSKSFSSVKYSPVSYLPSPNNFSSFGLFASLDIKKDSQIPGIVGLVAEIYDEEVIEGQNTVSLIQSGRYGLQWVLLGPVSFINASCNANVAFVRHGKIVSCVTLKDVKQGEELTINYSRHYFGEFNVDCLCPHKDKHGPPFPELPPNRKRKQILSNLSPNIPPFVSSTPFKKCYLPSRSSMVPKKQQKLEFRPTFLSYDTMFGSLDSINNTSSSLELSSVHGASICGNHLASIGNIFECSYDAVPSPSNDENENPSAVAPTIFDLSDILENDISEQNQNTSEEARASQLLETELFEGSSTTLENFMSSYNITCEKHKLSEIARKEILQLFAKTLPQPNKINSELAMPHMPLVTSTTFSEGKFLVVDLYEQLENKLERNMKHIKESWSSSCSWKTHADSFCFGEVQINLNWDGVPLFKSAKTAIWPIWAQVHNFPPVLRSSFWNMCLFGLWHGDGKPQFNQMLDIISCELERICTLNYNVNGLGSFKVKFRSMICDMPAKAYALCMKQHMGYDSCPHCFIQGVSKGNRMLFGARKAFILREQDSFEHCGRVAGNESRAVNGVKRLTPLHKFLRVPWDFPIDPMHQVCAGTGKVLTKCLLSLVKNCDKQHLENLISLCKVPLQIKHRPKKTEHIKFWKTWDFKLFFFHLAPLVFFKFPLTERIYYSSFCKLSIAVRLLSNRELKEQNIEDAEELINLFFEDFVQLYGEELQTFNFHAMRHLVEQVKRNGPLWSFTAFGFESANGQLTTSVPGTIKNPKKLIEKFIKHQKAHVDYLMASETDKKCCLENLTNVSENCKQFSRNLGVKLYFGRFIDKFGVQFGSVSYSRASDNLGESIVQLRNGDFVHVETFAKLENNEIVVIARIFQMVEPIDITCHSKESFGLLFKLSKTTEFKIFSVKELVYKTVVLPFENKLLVSVMKEGFDHE